VTGIEDTQLTLVGLSHHGKCSTSELHSYSTHSYHIKCTFLVEKQIFIQKKWAYLLSVNMTFQTKHIIVCIQFFVGYRTIIVLNCIIQICWACKGW